MLGWDEPAHSLNDSYSNWVNKNGDNSVCTIPLATPIATLRLLQASDIQVAKVVNATPAALSLNPDSVKTKLDNLASYGLDVAKVVNALPAILCLNPDSVRAKIANLQRLANILGWQGSVVDLVHYKPAILGDRPQKLRTLARFAADHIDASGRSASVAQVASGTLRPIDSHLAAIASGSYEASNVQREQKHTPAKDRRAKSLEIIRNPKLAEELGAKTIAAYYRYAPLKTSVQVQKPSGY